MSAFSENQRRILSLWLPRLPIDRIKRELASNIGAPDSDVSHHTSGRLSLPPQVGPARLAQTNNAQPGYIPVARGRAGEGGITNSGVCGLPPSLTKGGGNSNDDEPSVVVAKENNALVIYSLDDAAARFNLDAGLPLANARAICPKLRVFDADVAADAKTLEHIADWCDRFTPLVALDPPHGLFLDITGCAHLFGGEAKLLKLVCDALTVQGFAVSAAIASTSICARTMTRHIHGRIVGEGEEQDAVGPLPVSALGADATITVGLRRAGLKTIRDVASREPSEITARFGAAFSTLLVQALGQGDAPISPRKLLPDFIVEKRFAEPVATDTVILATLSRLAQTLVASMEKQGKGARRLEASFFRTDGTLRAIEVETGQPVMHANMVERLFRERLDALSDPLDPGFGFDLIRLAASHTEIVVQQQRDLDAQMFNDRVHDNDELSALIDRIVARIGTRRVVVHLPQDSHIPERAQLMVLAQQHLTAACAAQWGERTEGEPPLRPLRLFERPEPITVPMATVPDGPPHHFTWRRAVHAVVRVEGPERIAMEWWKQDSKRLTRDYFRIEDENGLRFWIFRDGLYGDELTSEEGFPVAAKWYLHGLFA